MCGIVGVLSTELNTFNHPYGKFFKQALFADTLRGVDSTGIMLLDSSMEQPEVWKKALAGYDFLQLARTNHLLKDTTDYNVMIGHNRAATRGSVNHQTAHPFQIGDITMVHNGTVQNHRTLPKGNSYSVDSEAICHALGELGVEETVERLNGAFTLIWHDKRDQSVNIVRNEERPIAFGKVKDNDTILLASESTMLRWLAIRTGMSLESIVEPKAGELFTFHPYKENKDWIDNVNIRTLKLRKAYVPPARGDYNGGYRHNALPAPQQGGSRSNVSDFQSRSSTQNANAILKNMKLEKGEGVVVRNLTFEPYNSSKNPKNGNEKGKVYGEIEGNKVDHIAVLHGIDRSFWEKDIKGKHIYGDVAGACWNPQQKREILVATQDMTVFPPVEGASSTVNYVENEDDFTDDDDEACAQGGGTSSRTFRGRDGVKLTLLEFNRAVQDGCAMCSGNIEAKDADKTGWTHDTQPICKSCIKDHDLGDYLC